MRVLFIGNSHTYVNDMPELFAGMAREKGIPCEVTMIAHGGWFLHQHQKEPDVRFNILFGNYDYVVLQEHAHPFGAGVGHDRGGKGNQQMDTGGREHPCSLYDLGGKRK